MKRERGSEGNGRMRDSVVSVRKMEKGSGEFLENPGTPDQI